MIKILKNLFLFLFIIGLAFAEDEKYYMYKIRKSNELFKKMVGAGLLGIDGDEIDYFRLWIRGDQKKVKDGDLLSIVLKDKHSELKVYEIYLKFSPYESWYGELDFYLKNPSGQFGEPLERNIIIDEKDILTIPGITLNLTYNNNSQIDQVQIHGDQDIRVSKILKKNEKEFVDQSKYIKSEIKGTTVYYTMEEDEIGGEAITLRDIDLDGEKSKVLRTNLDVTRFFYVSDSALFAQEVRVTDLNTDDYKDYKVWQSKKDSIIPNELEKHGIRPGDMKAFKITNYDMAPTPFIKKLKYRKDPKYRELSDNIYEYRKKQKPVIAYYFKPRLLSNLPSRKPAWVLVDNKISKKFVYLLEEEYKFKENDEKEVVFAPVDDGGKTTVKTLGDIQRVWVPAITSFIVILGLL